MYSRSRTSGRDSPPISTPNLLILERKEKFRDHHKTHKTEDDIEPHVYITLVHVCSLKLKVQEKLCPHLNPSILQHNRLASYFPFRAKLLEKVAASQVQCFLINTNLFKAFQSGLLHCTIQRHLVSVSSRISSSLSGILLHLV